MNSPGMTIRILAANRLTSAITVSAFALSMAMALVLLSFIAGEYRTDMGYPGVSWIFRVTTGESGTSVMEAMRNELLRRYPLIGDATLYNNFESVLSNGDRPYKGNMIVTDTSFFRIFSLRFIVGSPGTSLAAPNNVVLTRSFAGKIFGDEDPVGRTLVAEYRFSIRWILILVACLLVISFVSGIYAAIIVSGLSPFSILMKREKVKKGTTGLRAMLNIFQIAVSVSLIAALIIIVRQVEYLKNSDQGYDTGHIIRGDIHWQLAGKTEQIYRSLVSDPNIGNVCISHGTPGMSYLSSNWEPAGDNLIQVLTTDTSFFKVFRIPLKAGREPLSSDYEKVCYLNETAFRKTGWDSFQGKKFFGFEIIGIVKDFKTSDLYSPVSPMIVLVSSENGVSHLSLRVSDENIGKTITRLKETWAKYCDFAFFAALAFVISFPVSWYLMDHWLSRFAFHTRLPAWIFVIAGASGIILTALTVTLNVWNTIIKNPAEALKTEWLKEGCQIIISS